MSDKIRVSAKTKEDAITKALIQLHTTSDHLSYSVLVEGKNGVFGIGAKPWIIEAAVKDDADLSGDIESIEKEIHNITTGKDIEKSTDDTASKVPAADVTKDSDQLKNQTEQAVEAPKTEPIEKPSVREDPSDQKHYKEKKQVVRDSYAERDEKADEARDPESSKPKVHEVKPISDEEADEAMKEAGEFVKSILSLIDMEVSIETGFDHTSNELSVNLSGPDMGLLIGKRGQTLDSLQYLISLVVNKKHKEDYIRVKLDTEDYRARREATLRNLARNIAFKVKKSRKEISLEPMNPYERRIIHSALQNDKYVTTRSEGEEPFRHVIVYLKKSPRGGYNGYRRDRRGRNSFSEDMNGVASQNSDNSENA